MGTVYVIETPAGNRVRVYEPEYINGIWTGRRISGSGATEREARKRLSQNKLKREVANGSRPISELLAKGTTVNMTLTRYARSWVTSAKVRESTRRNYRNAIELHILPELGERELRKLSSTEVNKFFTQTLPEKRTPTGEPLLSANAIRNVWTVLNMIFKDAMKAPHKYVIENPLAALTPPERATRDTHHLTEARHETATLREHLRGHPDAARWGFSLIGLRQSEKLGLTWDCVHLDGKQPFVEVKQSLVRTEVTHGCGHRKTDATFPCGEKTARKCPNKNGVSGYTVRQELKNKSSKRRVPLPSQLVDDLKVYQKVYEERIAANPDGDHITMWVDVRGNSVKQQQDSRQWRALLEAAGLEFREQHSNRHLAISNAVANGAQMHAVKELVGHSKTSRITEEIYLHISMEEKQKAMDAMNS